MGRMRRRPGVQVNTTALPAETRTMRSRKTAHDQVPSEGAELENWLHDLVDGKTTARRLRRRMQDEAGDQPEADCTVCDGTSTGKIYFGLDGHLHGRLPACPDPRRPPHRTGVPAWP